LRDQLEKNRATRIKKCMVEQPLSGDYLALVLQLHPAADGTWQVSIVEPTTVQIVPLSPATVIMRLWRVAGTGVLRGTLRLQGTDICAPLQSNAQLEALVRAWLLSDGHPSEVQQAGIEPGAWYIESDDQSSEARLWPGRYTVKVRIKNLTGRLVSLSLNSGTALHLAPGAVSDEILEVEISDNPKIDKLRDRHVIDIHTEDQKETFTAEEARSTLLRESAALQGEAQIHEEEREATFAADESRSRPQGRLASLLKRLRLT